MRLRPWNKLLVLLGVNMYFHGIAIMAGDQFMSLTNESHDSIMNKMVIPFINGQVIESNTDPLQQKKFL